MPDAQKKRFIEFVSIRIGRRRKELDLEPEDVAAFAGRSVDTGKNWENANHSSIPNSFDIVRVAQGLKVSVEWLLKPSPDPVDDRESTDPEAVFIFDQTVVDRQLAATSSEDKAFNDRAWFQVDRHCFTVHSIAERDRAQSRIDAHLRKLRKRGV